MNTIIDIALPIKRNINAGNKMKKIMYKLTNFDKK